MEIISDKSRTVTTEYRTIDVIDGPIISAGDSYIDGTYFRVERIKINNLAGQPPQTIKVSGPRVNKKGVKQKLGTTQIEARHELVIRLAEVPTELHDVIAAADKL